jgi:CubicO group peptidase (beta-lactamase class C family)
MQLSRIKKALLLCAAGLLSSSSQAWSQTKPASQEAHIQRIQAAAVDLSIDPNAAPVRLSLQKLMELYKIPGLSIAVIDNYQIVWAKAYGITDVGSQTPVTTKTLFQAGSISKPIAATGALWLVEKGKLSLDEDVNQTLKTWKVPENEFTKTEKVTLRRLMSHTGGLTVHGFPGYDIDEPLPTLVQIFNGEKPANTEAIRVDIVPGAEERYSGGELPSNSNW